MSLTNTIRFLDLILRNNPETIGISLDDHGWANVEELISGISKKYEFNMDILEKIVRSDNKQRYSFNEDKTLIRANHGYIMPMDVEPYEAEPPEMLWYGTGEKYETSIDDQGVLSQNRLYVHLSKDKDTAAKIGSRYGKIVIYSINAGDMYHDGYKFLLSHNGAWLTKEVPVKYLVKQ